MSRELNVVARPATDSPDQLRPIRRSTPSVSVGGVLVGSAHPIVVQSMTNLFNDFFFAWGLPPLTTAGFLGCSVIQHYITYCQKPILTLLDG